VTDYNVFLQYIGIYAVILLFEFRSWNVTNRKQNIYKKNNIYILYRRGSYV